MAESHDLEQRAVRSPGESSSPSSSRSSQNSDSTPSFPRISPPDHAPNVLRTSTVISSPLNPASSDRTNFNSLSRKSIVTRFPSEEARALGDSSTSSRNSMILYHLVDFPSSDGSLPSPPRIHSKRESINSLFEDTIVSVSYDSKYPSGSLGASERGLIAYAYDPALDDEADDDDWKDSALVERESVSKRGILNVGGLMTLFFIAIGFLVILPIVDQKNHAKNWLISHNPRINATGQAEDGLDFIPNRRRNEIPSFDSVHIDPLTPTNARRIMVPRAKNTEAIFDLIFSQEGGSSCESNNLHGLDPSPSHLVETRYRDGFRSFWHNGIWEHVKNDDVVVPLFVTSSGRFLLSRRFVEFEVDQICQDDLHVEYIRIYRIS